MKFRLLLFLLLCVVMKAEEMRVMTYNIYGSRLADGKQLGENIKEYKPDFVVLQEVDKNTNRSQLKDVTYDISQALGYNYFYFKKSRDFDSGEFGISFVSRYPIEKIYTYELPSIGVEKRQVLAAKIDKKVFGKSVLIIGTHLDYKEEVKNSQINELMISNEIFEGDIKFLAGDLNLLPNSQYYENIKSNWNDTYLEGDNKLTLDGQERKQEDPRIDYVFGDKSNTWKTKESFFINNDGKDWTKFSDHLPYMAVIEID